MEDLNSNQQDDDTEPIDYKAVILAQLEKLGSGGSYLWITFILCLTPCIMNGLHASSYVFFAAMPDDYFCMVPALKQNNFTDEQVRTITVSKDTPDDHCYISDWNYALFAGKSYFEVLNLIERGIDPVRCGRTHGSHFVYNQTSRTSVVAEWNLVCGQKLWRTNLQMVLSVGKFLGSFMVGIFADRYGRKTSVSTTIILYMISGLLSFLTTSYWLFFIARFLLGFAGAGVYFSAYTLLAEIVSTKERAKVSTLHSLSYPLGSCFLAIIAYFIRDWRQLQMALCLPAFLFIIQIKYLDESPRWLISKNRLSEAYEIVFRKKKDIVPFSAPLIQPCPSIEEPKQTFKDKVQNALHELSSLFGSSRMRNRILICYFGWFVVTFAYYVIALNGENMSANNYEYIFIMGITELPSCFLTVLILKYFGRRGTCLLLLALSSISLSALLAIPNDQTQMIMIMALFGRFCISSAYIVVILHTAELFPTEVRNSAIGSCSMTSHIGSVLAPYVVDVLGAVAWFIPTTICAGLALMAGFLIMFLPETKNQALKDRVEEVMDEKLKSGHTPSA